MMLLPYDAKRGPNSWFDTSQCLVNLGRWLSVQSEDTSALRLHVVASSFNEPFDAKNSGALRRRKLDAAAWYRSTNRKQHQSTCLVTVLHQNSLSAM